MMADILLQLFAVLCLLAISQSSVAQTDGSEISPCNSCSQGPGGIPGIPGVAGAAGIPGSMGNHGLPGRDGIGMKGEAGSKGDTGESGEMGMEGPAGPQGPSGEHGDRGAPGLQGIAGKVGPLGLAGMDGNNGAIGDPGLKGQKGEMGGESSGRRSAFSVVKTSSQIGSTNEALTFDLEETNIGGHFNLGSNKFTCQIPGTYVFMFTISTGSSSHTPAIDLVKDGAKIARVLIRETDSAGSAFSQGSQSMVVQLGVGNKVWLRFANSGEQVYSDSDKYTTFSGFLLYEN